MRYLFTALLLTSCTPTLLVNNDIVVSFEYLDTYSIMHIDANDYIYNAKMKITGQDIKYNDDHCTVEAQTLVCNIPKFKNYTLPFKGIVNSLEINYMSVDGKAKYYSYP